ncbi:protein LIKE COV 2-like isoform X1 [Zingiber officinale]|uniref:protein LIKE COV 2-like isoform X1 n=1 Tax=Zingiber officinale TaxID=94328 RepID=UPI001C4C3186|nr:protein LIKE COV 2-like isoform X1 [Zingiber officinale]
MAEEKESTSIPLSQAVDPEDPAKAPPISPSSSTRKACGAVLQSWVSKKFMTGCVVLFPVAVTFYITWWFIQFVDGLLLTLFYILDVSGRMSVGSRLHTVLAVDVYSDKIKHLFDATEGQEAARRPWGGWI